MSSLLNETSCGGCTVCCNVLQVNDIPGGIKQSYRPCPHLWATCDGCAIYQTRPNSCRAFECHYIKLQRRPDLTTPVELRPDKSGVMLMHGFNGLYFTAHCWDSKRPDAWRESPVIETIQQLCSEGFRVVVSVGPTPQKILLFGDGKGGVIEQSVNVENNNGESAGTPAPRQISAPATTGMENLLPDQ